MGPNRLGDFTDKTESYRTAFGADFGNPFTGETYTPNDIGDTDRPLPSKSDRPVETETNVTHTLTQDDAEVGDQPFSSDSDRLRGTESHRTEFGMGCGNQFIPRRMHRNQMMLGNQIIHSRSGPSAWLGLLYPLGTGLSCDSPAMAVAAFGSVGYVPETGTVTSHQ